MALMQRLAKPLWAHQSMSSILRPHLRSVPALTRTYTVKTRAQRGQEPSQPQRGISKLPIRAILPADAVLPVSIQRMNNFLRDLNEEMDRAVGAFGGVFPQDSSDALLPLAARVPGFAVDVKETKDKYTIEADVPGMHKDDVKVRITPDKMLEISGERRQTEEEKDEEGKLHRVERTYGKFLRRFQLPEVADISKISAKTENGVLTLVVPKTEPPKPEFLEVKVEGS